MHWKQTHARHDGVPTPSVQNSWTHTDNTTPDESREVSILCCFAQFYRTAARCSCFTRVHAKWIDWPPEDIALKEAQCDAITFWTKMVTAAKYPLLHKIRAVNVLTSHNVWVNLQMCLHSPQWILWWTSTALDSPMNTYTCISVSAWPSHLLCQSSKSWQQAQNVIFLIKQQCLTHMHTCFLHLNACEMRVLFVFVFLCSIVSC